ncbi:MAG: alanine racemase [Endomicrobia bacterium]|nr:alanine racemase [Endomicrobiia bacterium]MDW8055462.1 alanine racemase [Elusimicrobiota bacterium]
MNIFEYNKPFLSRPTWIEINHTALEKNIQNLYKFIERNKEGNKKVSICAIIKSNAYGHGLVQIGGIVNKFNFIKILGITSVEEAYILRHIGVKKQILLLGSIYPFSNFKYLIEYNITPTVASVYLLEEMNKFAKKHNVRINFHLKIDTGMGRIGIIPENINKFIESYSSMSNVFCEGIYTHFSSAANDKGYTMYQLRLFNQAYNRLISAGIRPKYVHAANSAGIILYPESYFNMVRPGLAMYGMLPFKDVNKIVDLKPVLSLKSRIVFLKTLPKGRYISYSKTYCTKKKTKIATIPVGYADGLLRKLSNIGKVIVKGRMCDIIGRVTMDMLMIDVTKVKNVEIGDEVIFIGQQKDKKITVEDVARWSETINYEITTRLSERIPRIVT